MKKRFFIVGLIAVFGFGVFLASCKKEAALPTCKCTFEDYYYGDEFTETIDLSDEDDLEDFLDPDAKVGDVKTCKELAKELEYEWDEYDVSCKEK